MIATSKYDRKMIVRNVVSGETNMTQKKICNMCMDGYDDASIRKELRLSERLLQYYKTLIGESLIAEGLRFRMV